MTNESFLFQKILDKIKDGVIVFDPSLNIIFMNKKAERLIQIGFSVFGDIAAYFNLGDSPESLKRPRRVEHNDRILEFSYNIIRVGKQSYPLLFISDSTMLARLENESYCYSTILNSINEGVIMTNSKGYITFYNKQLQKFEGLDAANVVGRHMTEVYNITEEASDQLSVWKTKKPVVDRYRKFLTADNRELYSIGSAYPILKNGKIIAVFTVCRNLTKIQELLNKTMQAQEKATENIFVEDFGNNTRFQLSHIVAKSDIMLDLLKKTRKAALVNATVLVWGETGTGKELVVQGIHNENPLTQKKPFCCCELCRNSRITPGKFAFWHHKREFHRFR
ncbi:MAG: PAS domain S-box protein [Bacillota bacterium]